MRTYSKLILILSLLAICNPLHAALPHKSKVSENDTTPGFINGKLVEGAGITFVEGNDGGNETLTISALGAGTSLPVIDTTSIIEGSVDDTKEIRFEVDGLTTGTVRVITPLDEDFTMVGLESIQTLTNKTLTSPTINTPAMGADSIDAITEIATAIKSGVDGKVVTGTAGGSGNCAEWNADGDLVEAASAAACGSGGSGDNVSVNSTGADTTANLLDGDIDWTLVDGGPGGPDDITGTVGCTGCIDSTDLADSINVPTELTIPQGASPTVDAAGEVAIDTTNDDFIYYGAAKRSVPYVYQINKTLESPADADSFKIWKPHRAVTIIDIECIVDPADSGESVVIDIQECDSDGDTCTTVDATITCGNTTTSDDGALSNGTIDADDWVNWDIGTVTGTVTEVAVRVKYTYDAT